jgi:hypothetical protein
MTDLITEYPFIEISKGFDKQFNAPYVIRYFTQETTQEELEWHQDKEDRLIFHWSGSKDWLFQYDDALPVSIDSPIFIERNDWHRLIKGTGDLFLKIIKFE